jgi:opacity protein-like surface antigen
VSPSRSLLLLVLSASQGALAAERWANGIDGVGRISVVAGWKLTPNDYFFARAEEQGYPLAWRGHGGPQGGASFGYGATSFIEASIDLFIGYDRFTVAGFQPINAYTYGALLGVRFTFMDLLLPGLAPFVGVGVGPTLGYVVSPGTDPVEKLITGVAGTAGVTYRVSDRIGISLEYRFLYARGMWITSGVNVGGSWFSLGVVVYFPKSSTASDRMLGGP